MSSTNHMLSIMRPDSNEEHHSSSVDELPRDTCPVENTPEVIKDRLPTPSLTMAEVLTQCLSSNKKTDPSPQ